MGKIYYPDQELLSRFSGWDVKGLAPHPMVTIVTNNEGMVYLTADRSGNRIPVKGGGSRELSKGDRLWVEMFAYRNENGRLCKAARLIKLDENYVPKKELYNVWYDAKAKAFRDIKERSPHILTHPESTRILCQLLGFDLGILMILPR
jgi:hypothetical protein